MDVAEEEASKNAGVSLPEKPIVDRIDTQPTAPTAATRTDSGSNMSTDGTAFSYMTFSIPALPDDATKQFLMYKLSTSTQWLTAAGPFTNTTTLTDIRVPDLTPGLSYAFATIAFSGLDLASTATAATGSPYTAAGDTTLPAAPTGVSYVAGDSVNFKRPATLSGGARVYNMRVHWTAPADKDVAFYEWIIHSTDTDADATAGFPGPYAGPNSYESVPVTEVVPFALARINPSYFRVRAVDWTGNRSAWAGGGTNVYPYWAFSVGSMVGQDANAVALTGGTADALAVTNSTVSASTLSNVTLNSVASGTEATARSALALGTLATQNKTAVDIDGGDVQGLSRLSTGNFFANDTASGISGGGTAVDVKDVNFRIYSGSTQKARIDYTNGDYITQGGIVYAAQHASNRFELKVNGGSLEVYLNGSLFKTL